MAHPLSPRAEGESKFKKNNGNCMPLDNKTAEPIIKKQIGNLLSRSLRLQNMRLLIQNQKGKNSANHKNEFIKYFSKCEKIYTKNEIGALYDKHMRNDELDVPGGDNGGSLTGGHAPASQRGYNAEEMRGNGPG